MFIRNIGIIATVVFCALGCSVTSDQDQVELAVMRKENLILRAELTTVRTDNLLLQQMLAVQTQQVAKLEEIGRDQEDLSGIQDAINANLEASLRSCRPQRRTVSIVRH